MSTEQNRKLAEELFARLSAADVPGALPAAGTYTKERLKNGLRMTVKGTIAEAASTTSTTTSFSSFATGRSRRCANT